MVNNMDDITIKARLDTQEAEEQESEWRLRLRQLNRDISQTKLELRRTQLYAVGLMSSIMGITSALITFLPEPFRLVGQAAVGVITTTITALSAVALAYSAGGPLFWFQAAMAAVGVGIAVYSLAAAVTNQERLDDNVTRFTGMLRSLSNSLAGITRSLGV